MKRNYILLILLAVAVLAMPSCKDEDPTFDIDWPAPVINSFSPERDTVEKTLTITGANFVKLDYIRVGGTKVAADNIVSQTETEIVVNIPRVLQTGPVEIGNVYEKSAISAANFTPLYPATSVTGWPSEVKSEGRVNISGENMDFVYEARVNGQLAGIASASASLLVIDTKGMNLVVESEASIELKSYGDISGATATLTVLPPDDLPVGANPYPMLNFEDAQDLFSPWDGSPVAGQPRSQINGGDGIDPHVTGGSFYQTVTVPDVTAFTDWGPYFGEVYFGDKGGLAGTDSIDLSSYRAPHLSFLVNTGNNAAQFAMEIYEAEKFANWSSLIATNGQWQWVSIPFGPEESLQQWGSNGYDGDVADGELDYSKIRYVQLGLGIASVGQNGYAAWEAHIDRMMITDGPVNSPSNGPLTVVSTVWDFEDGIAGYKAGDWQSDVSSSSNINGGGQTAPQGDNYLEVVANVTKGGWNWYGNLEAYDLQMDLSETLNPHISFYVNNQGKAKQFEMEIGDALGGKWGTNFVAPAYDGWQIITVNLNTSSFGNWGADTDAPDLSGLSHLKIGFNANLYSDGETVKVYVDNVVVTEGRVEMIAPPTMDDLKVSKF